MHFHLFARQAFQHDFCAVHQHSRHFAPFEPPLITKKPLSEGLLPPPSGQDSLFTKSGRSGGAGYTDPNNQNEPDYNCNDSGGEADGVNAEGLVGFGWRHRGVSRKQNNAEGRQMQGGILISNYYEDMIWAFAGFVHSSIFVFSNTSGVRFAVAIFVRRLRARDALTRMD